MAPNRAIVVPVLGTLALALAGCLGAGAQELAAFDGKVAAFEDDLGAAALAHAEHRAALAALERDAAAEARVLEDLARDLAEAGVAAEALAAEERAAEARPGGAA